MKVKALFFGSIKQSTGHSEYEVILSEGSKLLDLINRLGHEFGKELKKSLIQGEKSSFPLLIIVGKKDHRFNGGMDANLYEGIKVYFYPAVAGG